tara:strand:- start:582 stop:800 length:219 start_codon:yes stop_codon:yes gene_type:complete
MANNRNQSESWEKDANLVLHRLDTIDSELKNIDSRLRHIEKSVWVLQAKSAVIGAIAGMASALVSLFIKGGM